MFAEKTFKALSDANRRKILEILRDGKMTAGEILQKFDITGATLSHHLACLRDAGLIIDEKQGKYIYYELNTSVFEDILVWFSDFGK
ncbi:MAG: autorepressor SdpR family transcription factor [Oscillospiraceae bacterium]